MVTWNYLLYFIPILPRIRSRIVFKRVYIKLGLLFLFIIEPRWFYCLFETWKNLVFLKRWHFVIKLKPFIIEKIFIWIHKPFAIEPVLDWLKCCLLINNTLVRLACLSHYQFIPNRFECIRISVSRACFYLLDCVYESGLCYTIHLFIIFFIRLCVLTRFS